VWHLEAGKYRLNFMFNKARTANHQAPHKFPVIHLRIRVHISVMFS